MVKLNDNDDLTSFQIEKNFTMFLQELNPIIFGASLLGGYCLWVIFKMASRTSASNNKGM